MGFGDRELEYLVQQIAREFLKAFNERRTARDFIRA